MVENRNLQYDLAIIYLLEVSFIDSRTALHRLTQLADSSEGADPNRDHSSSEWASFPFTRNFVYHLGGAHSLDKTSSE